MERRELLISHKKKWTVLASKFVFSLSASEFRIWPDIFAFPSRAVLQLNKLFDLLNIHLEVYLFFNVLQYMQ